MVLAKTIKADRPILGIVRVVDSPDRLKARVQIILIGY